jgi:hypothetical protein
MLRVFIPPFVRVFACTVLLVSILQVSLLLGVFLSSIVLVRHSNKEHTCINKPANMHAVRYYADMSNNIKTI